MRNLLLLGACLLGSQASIYANDGVVNNDETLDASPAIMSASVVPDTVAVQTETVAPKVSFNNPAAMDLNLTLMPKYDTYGFRMGFDVGKYTYFDWGMSYCFGSLSNWTTVVGYGLQGRKVLGGSFMLSGAVYPYVGFAWYDVMKYSVTSSGSVTSSKDSKFELTYGAAAHVSAGLCVYTFKRDKSKLFITLGYYVGAPEFETKGMLDNGNWSVGIAIVN